jgi:hypothetical protein
MRCTQQDVQGSADSEAATIVMRNGHLQEVNCNVVTSHIINFVYLISTDTHILLSLILH